MMNCLGVQLKWNYLRQKQSDISGIYSGKRRIAYGSYGRFSSMIYRLKNNSNLCFIVQVLLNYQMIVADKMRIHQLTD